MPFMFCVLFFSSPVKIIRWFNIIFTFLLQLFIWYWSEWLSIILPTPHQLIAGWQGKGLPKKRFIKKLLITFVNLRLYSHGQQNPDKINVKLKSSPTPKYNSKLNYVDTGLDLHYNWQLSRLCWPLLYGQWQNKSIVQCRI